MATPEVNGCGNLLYCPFYPSSFQFYNYVAVTVTAKHAVGSSPFLDYAVINLRFDIDVVLIV